MNCPNCYSALVRVESSAGWLWACSACAGRLTALPVLRRLSSKHFVSRLWRNGLRANVRASRNCPICLNPLTVATDERLAADICAQCFFVWFDGGELGEAHRAARAETDLSIPLEIEETPDDAAERHEVELQTIAEQQRQIDALKRKLHETRRKTYIAAPAGWRKLAHLFGLPYETGAEQLERAPFLTWGLAALMLIASVATLLATEVSAPVQPDLMDRILAVVAQPTWLSLGLNLYLFLIFGDNCEDVLRRVLYLSLIAASAALYSALTDFSLHSAGAAPLLGGIIGFYCMRFPYARIAFAAPLYRGAPFFNAPAWLFASLWFALQALGDLSPLGRWLGEPSLLALAATLVFGGVAGFFARGG